MTLTTDVVSSSPGLNALLGRRSCPFIEPRAWFTIDGSRV
jgi:hypothetical protein